MAIGDFVQKITPFTGSKGGGGQGPKPIDPFAEAQAQIQLERERATLQEEQRIATEQRAAAQREVDLGTFNTKVGQAFGNAQQTGSDFFASEGLNLDRFLPLLDQKLNQTRQGIPELASDPSSFFNPLQSAQGVLDTELRRDRRGFNLDIDKFAGDNFANTLLPGSFDDATIESILGGQRTDATSAITRARDRGSLSDFGFESALSNIDTQAGVGRSRLQDLGGGILENNRNALRDIGSQARSRADAFQFGDSFNPSSFGDRIDTLFGEQSGRLEGDIRGALGGEGLFNIGDILARAGSAQGSQNSTVQSPALLSAISRREDTKNQRRGIGSQGAF